MDVEQRLDHRPERVSTRCEVELSCGPRKFIGGTYIAVSACFDVGRELGVHRVLAVKPIQMNPCPSPGAGRAVCHKVGQLAVKGAQYARGLRHDGSKIKRCRRALPYDIALRRCLMRHHGPREPRSSQL